MSDDESSASSSDGEDLETTGLIATRAKRATAGNLYATLRANLDDEELQKELLAEDEEEDAGDYEGSDAGDDDEAFESSSDEEDAGPPQAGQAEDLEGEKALKRQERNEAKRKRKAQDAKLKIPAWRKKKVKMAEGVKTEDGSSTPAERPKKKSERSNWLPSPADAPMRQSRRSLAVANREVVHANLKQSAARSENQKRIMKNAAERENKAKVTASLTQEERMKKCEVIERQTAKEFGRWEREEAERQRARDEALAAKRRRAIDGPVIRWWSGSCIWEGDRMKVRRVEGKKVEQVNEKEGDSTEVSTPVQAESATQPPPVLDQKPSQPADASASWLQGIEQYASQTPAYTPSAPALNTTPTVYPHPPPVQAYHGWPPGTHQFALPPPPPVLPSPVPLLREQAMRTLVILQNFDALETPASTKRASKAKVAESTIMEPSALTNTFLPDSHPSFSAEETRYLTTRPRRRLVQAPSTVLYNKPLQPQYEVPLPPPPAKMKCAVTSWPAKFLDPKTGLGYADVHQYKVLQRALAGGCLWSSLLGAWVGPSYGKMGRAARGVPEGFGAPVKKAIKIEGAAG